eukprot:6476021-Amphidinium_carterae.1
MSSHSSVRQRGARESPWCVGGPGNSVGVGGSDVPLGHPRGGSVEVGSSDGTPNSVGPGDRVDPWS